MYKPHIIIIIIIIVIFIIIIICLYNVSIFSAHYQLIFIRNKALTITMT